MTSTAIRPTEAHYGLLGDIHRGLVIDLMLVNREIPHLLARPVPVPVATLVWDLEALEWAWRPVNCTTWQLTDQGRTALEDGGM